MDLFPSVLGAAGMNNHDAAYGCELRAHRLAGRTDCVSEATYHPHSHLPELPVLV